MFLSSSKNVSFLKRRVFSSRVQDLSFETPGVKFGKTEDVTDPFRRQPGLREDLRGTPHLEPRLRSAPRSPSRGRWTLRQRIH